MVDEADGFEGGSCGMQIGPADEKIDVARIADGVLVHPADPLGDGVATGDGVRYAGRVERAGRPAQPLLDLLRCHERPLPTDGLDGRFCHDKRSSWLLTS